MADEAQVRLLKKKSSAAWNEWRKSNPETRPDLSKADLFGVHLMGHDLSGADLSHANLCDTRLGDADLHQANLAKADLVGANLYRADLRNANLRGARLIGADFDAGDLWRADLSGTFLFESRLRGANLCETDFTNAEMGGVMLADVDLSQTKGLETIKHLTPSEITISTIYRSRGNITDAFLRGAGVPENFIEYMHSLVGTGFEYYSCFISYSSRDQDFAERIHADLQAKGVRCWFAPHRETPSTSLRQRR